MERRQFIRIAGAGAAAGIIGSNMAAMGNTIKADELLYHKISDIKFGDVKLSYPRQVGKNSQLDIHGWGPTSGIHILYTDKGASGWGMNRGSRQQLTERFEKMRAKPVADLVNPSTGVLSTELEAFDFSLFDLAGKILNKPVYQLLGRNKPELQLCYSGMIYFDDLEPADKPAGLTKILEECRFDYDYGYRQFKLKIGRGNKWMEKEKGLQRDIEVTRLVSKNFPDCDILVDGNNGFTSDEFIKYLEGIEGIKLFWIEEPFHETLADYTKLNTWLKDHNLNPLLADGEARPEEELLRDLGNKKLLDVNLQDISGYGFTKWIKLMAEIKNMGLLASPHAWGSAIKTNYCAHLCGAFGSTATIEGVTCTSVDVGLTDYKLKGGKLIPSSKPGFGMELMKQI
jgi:D-galactarolactone cycloisomerase